MDGHEDLCCRKNSKELSNTHSVSIGWWTFCCKSVGGCLGAKPFCWRDRHSDGFKGGGQQFGGKKATHQQGGRERGRGIYFYQLSFCICPNSQIYLYQVSFVSVQILKYFCVKFFCICPNSQIYLYQVSFVCVRIFKYICIKFHLNLSKLSM